MSSGMWVVVIGLGSYGAALGLGLLCSLLSRFAVAKILQFVDFHIVDLFGVFGGASREDCRMGFILGVPLSEIPLLTVILRQSQLLRCIIEHTWFYRVVLGFSRLFVELQCQVVRLTARMKDLLGIFQGLVSVSVLRSRVKFRMTTMKHSRSVFFQAVWFVLLSH